MKVFDPLADPGKHMVEIIDLDAERAKRQKLKAPKEVPVLDREWDEEANRYVETLNLVSLNFRQSDPGDER